MHLQAFCGPVATVAMACAAVIGIVQIVGSRILSFPSMQFVAQKTILGQKLPTRLEEFSAASLLLSIGMPLLKWQNPPLHVCFLCLLPSFRYQAPLIDFREIISLWENILTWYFFGLGDGSRRHYSMWVQPYLWLWAMPLQQERCRSCQREGFDRLRQCGGFVTAGLPGTFVLLCLNFKSRFLHLFCLTDDEPHLDFGQISVARLFIKIMELMEEVSDV